MKFELDNIKMYWWEGFYGFNSLFQRIINLKRPFVRNFGDLLSPFIISLLTAKNICHSTSSNKLLALGSIFFALSDHDVVWGAGLLNAKHIQYALSCREVKYLAVRGPETRKLLLQHHLTCPAVYGDPAILLPKLIKNDINKKHVIGIVPHFSHYHYFCNEVKTHSVKIINVEDALVKVVRDLLSCEVILSTSLHGLIVAEAYHIPALMLIVDKPLHGDLFKFEDYYHATERSLSFAQFEGRNINALADLALKQARPIFNTDALLNSFPFKKHVDVSFKTLSWGRIAPINYSHSIVPPRFRVPL